MPDARLNSNEAPDQLSADASIRRRITVIWALLFFNTLAPIGGATIIPIPQRVAQLLTMTALLLALGMAMTLNGRFVIQPNLVLTLFTLIALLALITSLRGQVGIGGILRSVRLLTFIGVLWLLTPWWGRRDLLLARCHLRVVTFVSATMIFGLLIRPSMALSVDGRLGSIFWPVWPTAVAHFGAMAVGLTTVLWFTHLMSRRRTLVVLLGGIAILYLSRTRVAVVALTLGLLCAAASLLLSHRRVRRVATTALLVAPMGAIALAPVLIAWFSRGQTAEEIADLTGRRRVWAMLLGEPRSIFSQWFGHGLTDKSFHGLAIDNSWLAIYNDQGRVAVIIVATILLFLLLAAMLRVAGPARALAVFIVIYCAVDSYTEVGLGDASPYLLDLIVAASLITPLAIADDDESQ